MSVFNPPPGLSWSVMKTPKFATRVQKSVSGRVLRVVDQPVPMWTWTLNIEVLRDDNDQRAPASIYNELREQMGFFLAQQGAFNSFLFDDPTDDTVTNQNIGTGDGSIVAFQLVRTMNGFDEPILAPNAVSAIYLNGVAQAASAYGVSADTGLVTFVTPPPLNAVITASFTYYFRVRFADDSLDFENFMVGLWLLKQLKLESVLL